MSVACILCGGNPSPFLSRPDLTYVRCTRCGLVWQPDPHIGDTYYADEMGITTDTGKIEARALDSDDRIRTFGRYIDLNNLCDIGCAEGTFLTELQKCGYTNVIGIEPNTYSFAEAKKRGLDVYQKSDAELGSLFAQKKISRVTLLHVIEHLLKPLAYLSNLRDAMKKGEYLIIETPDIDAASIHRIGPTHMTLNFEHVILYNEQTLRALLEKSGFRIIAAGRRDFNGRRMSIKNTLAVLGLYPPPAQKKGSAHEPGLKGNSSPRSRTESSMVERLIKPLIRNILYLFVVLLKREDYIWVIAQKS